VKLSLDEALALAPLGREPPVSELRARPVGLECRSAGAELLRLAPRILELGAGVGVHELAGLNPLETVAFQELGVRCFQQRPGNSASPEVDVAPPLGADWVLDRDVRDLEPSSGREHAEQLRKDGVLVGIKSITPFEITTSKLESGKAAALPRLRRSRR
jgi:hypothetical protein